MFVSVNSKYGPYGTWSACSVSCGVGSQTRTRPCIAGNSCGAPCSGVNTETGPCGKAIGKDPNQRSSHLCIICLLAVLGLAFDIFER